MKRVAAPSALAFPLTNKLARLVALSPEETAALATLFCSFSCEAAMYAEHLIDVGRRSAIERVAHFLLELSTRLRAMRRLREDALVSIEGQIAVIEDIEALAALADFEKIYLSRFRIGELLA